MVSQRATPTTSPARAQDATELDGKVVIITGGTTGIGRATAKLIAAQGAKVFIFGRHDKELHDALDEIRAGGSPNVHGTTADQSNGQDIERVFREADAQI